MRERNEENLVGECVNASFQGFFNAQSLHEDQQLNGVGVVIDDEFNFMLSHWRNSMLNGDSFLRTSSSHIVYGPFEKSLPAGMVVLQREPYKIFLNRISLKSKALEWYKEVAVFDSRLNIFYLVELSRKDDQETTIDPKISNSESSRYDRVRLQWKVRIVERCALKSDGTPVTSSRVIKRYDRKLEYLKGDYSLREQNQINLLASTLGNAFQNPSSISLRSYLKELAKNSEKISLSRRRQAYQDEETLLVGVGSRKEKEKRLGLTLSLTYDFVRSLGTYGQQGNLNGVGVQYRKGGDCFVGLFRQNILTKQYKFNQNNAKNISTFPIRQLLSQEHLKSLNYIHNTIYIPELPSIIAIASKIGKYIEAFEKEFEKRNLNYNETPSYQSASSEMMNIYKYVDLNRQKSEMGSSRPQIISDVVERDFKKPGFILNKSNNKSNNKSFEKSPLKDSVVEPRQASKSPLRHVRITGKIYRQSRPSKGHSPPKTYTQLKLDHDNYRRKIY